MPRIYKCKKCGEQHGPPTGKHCRARESTEDGEQLNPIETMMPLLLELQQQMAEMKQSIADNASRTPENVEREVESEDGESLERGEEEKSEEAAATYTTPESLRKDVRAMQRAAARIASIQSDDSDDEDYGIIRKSRKNGKKSGSVMTATDTIRDRIDWPHMYVKRTVGGRRVGVTYKELKVEEFVFGFVAMLRSPKCTMDKDVMLDILGMLMQDTIDFKWENARAFYEMLGVDVESGVREWTDADQIMNMRLIHSRANLTDKKEEKETKKPGFGKMNGATVRCCALYQKRTCEHTRDHHPFTHGCTYCQRVAGLVCRHPEEECYRKANNESKNAQKRE